MEIKELTPGKLHEFIYSKEYEEMDVIPISRHRALSHINNPRVASEDIIMLMAYEGDTMVGYLGIFADKIIQNQKEIKAGWLSCLWVNDRIRGKGVAKKLLERAFERWNGNILATEFTPVAKGLYGRLGKFNDLTQLIGLRGYLRFNLHELLPKKFPFLENSIFVLKAADALFNSFNALRLSFYRQQIINNRFEFANFIDEKSAVFIETENKTNLFKRGREELNWIVKYPWLVPINKPDHYSRRYHFSYGNKTVRYFNLVSHDESGKVAGYMMLLVRDRHLRVPYFYCRPEYMADAVAMIYQIMLKKNLFVLTVFHPELVKYIESRESPFFLRRKIRRHYIISKELIKNAGEIKNPVLQDGDGDCAFT